MNIENEIIVNKYGQDLLSLEELMNFHYVKISTEAKRMYLNDVINLIIQFYLNSKLLITYN